MTKKKTTPQTKSSVPSPKNKSVKDPQGYEWKQTGEFKIPGVDAMARAYEVSIPKEDVNALFKHLTAENKQLKDELYSKRMQEGDKENLPKSQVIKIEAPRLDVLIGELDGQLSRYYNAMNILDGLAEKLKSTPDKTAVPQGQGPIPVDQIGKLDNLIGVLNHLNNRLEGTNGYLANII